MANCSDLVSSTSDWISQVIDAEVLIVFSNEDGYKISKLVLQHLKRQGLRFIHPDLHYEPGVLEMDSISEAIQNSKHVLLILTNNQMSFTLEMFLALEKSIRSQQLCITVLWTEGFDNSMSSHMPFLQLATFVQLDNNRLEYCLNELITHIKMTRPLERVLPAGNFATGLAWMHYTGYLHLILPDLKNEIRDSKWFRQNPGRFPAKFYMLLPKTGQAYDLNSDKRIEKLGDQECIVIKRNIAGADRLYQLYIYKVCADDGTEYFFCAEIPSAFSVIGMIFHEIFAVNAEQRNLEVERFYYKLEEILNHSSNNALHGVAEIIPFDDEAKGDEATPSYHLLKAIENKNKTPVPDNLYSKDKKYKTDVCLMYCESDKGWAREIRFILEEPVSGVKKKVSKIIPPKESFMESEQRIKEAKWILLFISKEAVKHNAWVPLWLAELLSLSIEENKLRVLVVLGDDASPEDIPYFIRWVTYIDKREKHYREKILAILDGKSPKMSEVIPVGNVACGMVYAFLYNFLVHALKELEKRSRNKLKELDLDPSVTCVPVVFELIPQSCKIEDKLENVSHENFRIENLGKIIPISAEVAGKPRSFSFNMFKIVAKNQKQKRAYYFMGEYVTPIRTLYQMHLSPVSGLNNEQLKVQAKNFHDELKTMLGCPDLPKEIQKTCKLVMYDDSKVNVIDLMMNEIQETEREHETWKRMRNLK